MVGAALSPKALIASLESGRAKGPVGLVFGILHSQCSVSRKKGVWGKICHRKTAGDFSVVRGAFWSKFAFGTWQDVLGRGAVLAI